MYFNLTFLVSLNTKKKHPTVSRHMSSDVSPSGAGWQRTHLSASSSAEWSHYLLQSLTSNTPWQEFRMEIRNEALCALGKLTQQVSRELDNVQRKFMNPIFTTSRGSKSCKIFQRDICSSWFSATVSQDLSLSARHPFTTVTCILTSPMSMEQSLRAEERLTSSL